jgi:hypothetical protein
MDECAKSTVFILWGIRVPGDKKEGMGIRVL